MINIDLIQNEIHNIIIDNRLLYGELSNNYYDNLKKQGLNSIKLVELIVLLENKYNIEFSVDDLNLDNFENIHKISIKITEMINKNHIGWFMLIKCI